MKCAKTWLSLKPVFSVQIIFWPGLVDILLVKMVLLHILWKSCAILMRMCFFCCWKFTLLLLDANLPEKKLAIFTQMCQLILSFSLKIKLSISVIRPKSISLRLGICLTLPSEKQNPTFYFIRFCSPRSSPNWSTKVHATLLSMLL